MKIAVLIPLLLLQPVSALAHIEGLNDGGFLTGISHPVLGLDHLLAMLSVGILSAQIGGRAIWTIPTAFVVVMAVGGFLGIDGILLPWVENMIALSVFSLGTCIAMGRKFPAVMMMFFVGLFALFHGHAHGNEMPYLSNPWFYAFGFMVGTAGIHIAGVFIGWYIDKKDPSLWLLRIVGAYVGGMGLHLLIG